MFPRVISLFAGIGGFDLGFERAGFRLVAHVEKDEKCRELLKKKWPDAVALDDVCTAGKHNLPACDVVTFGFPCQDLSVAGKRAGLSGGRSGLFFEAMRIIDELQPAFCVWENVPGLYSSDGGGDFARVLLELERHRYFGACRCLDAQWFGVAQRRRRIFGVFARFDLGAECCTEILSVREGVRGNPPPRRETGKVAPSLAASGVGAGRTGNERTELDFCVETCPALTSSGRGVERTGETRGQDPVVAVNTGHGFWKEYDHAGTIGTQARGVHENNLAMISETMQTLRSGAAQDGPGHGARSGDCKDEYIVPVVCKSLMDKNEREQLLCQKCADACRTVRTEVAGLMGRMPIRGGSSHAFRMQAFGQYEENGTAGELKLRDHKDATDLIVEAGNE